MSIFNDLQTSLPVVYSVASAMALFYLSRKPINLDQYEALRRQEESSSDQHFQSQHQAQRSARLCINLARLGLTFFQLGLAIFSIFALSDNGDIIQVIAWSYALVLALAHAIRPILSNQFWIRPQLDVFYALQLVLASIRLYNTEIFTLPVSEWLLWLKVDVAAWVSNALLVWVSLVTCPVGHLNHAKALKEGEIPRVAAPEYSSSLYSQLTYTWVSPLVYQGFKSPVQDVDLPNLEDSDYSYHSLRLYRTIKSKTFTCRLLKTLRRDLFIQFLWSLTWCIMINASPYCLNKIIQYMECSSCGPPAAEIYIWVFGLFFASIFASLTMQAASHRGRRIYVRTFSICNAQILAKALRRKDMTFLAGKTDEDGKQRKEEDGKDGPTNIANLVSVDIKKLELPFSFIYQLYGYPIQFILAGIQLYQLLGYASLVGIGVMVLSYPLPARIYSIIMNIFKDVMKTKDERMDAFNEMLSAIRIVKFFGWESKFEEKITNIRERELMHTRNSYTQAILVDIVWMLIPLVNMVVVLVAYTKVFGHDISASKIFTTLSLFNIMRESINMLPWYIKSTVQAAVSIDRIGKFLEEEEIVRDTTVTKINVKAKTVGGAHPTIGFVNASFTWPNKEQEQASAIKFVRKEGSWFQKVKARFSNAPNPVQGPAIATAAPEERFKLKNVTADFPVGQLSVIVGPTGSGKSALLLALLGELDRVEGSMFLPRLDYEPNHDPDAGSGIAYVAQTAWLQNTTIRNNILFGKAYDEERYFAVIQGCALIPDFEILESGDNTEIGEQGITLSGGQKQRVALARAVYSDASVLLLDDCLSAVDTHTGKQLFQILTGPLLEGRTILMATHQVQLTIGSASFVLVLNKGEVVGTGTSEEVIRNGWVDSVSLTAPLDEDSEVNTLSDSDKVMKNQKEKLSVKLTEDEKRAEGAVAWTIYKKYMVASGGMLFWCGLVACFVIRDATDISQNAWLAIWANTMSEATGSFETRVFQTLTPGPVGSIVNSAFGPMNSRDHHATTMDSLGDGEKVNVNYYLGIYVLLHLAAMPLSVFMNYLFMIAGIRASRVLHQELLHKVTRAKVRFFDTTPIGRIMNRFSSDISTIDEDVNNGLQGLFSTVGTIMGCIAVISFNIPVFIIPAVFIMATYAAIAGIYMPVSRDLKRLHSNSRSPILNHINETVNGLVTIRAFGFQKRFLSHNLVNLDNNNRTFLWLWSTNRWLHWRVDIAGSFVVFSTGILVLQNWGKIEPGWAALSLTYSLMFTGAIAWVVRLYAQNEMNMNSVERVAEYMDLEEEPPAIIEGSHPPASWPFSGQIVVDHLTMKYAPDAPEVIKDISFTIKAGEKVGVVGRTGSGKSTLAVSMFRFMDPSKGTIRIDGIDICTIGLHDLRSKLTIIPQDPILFKGTLRSNLDPFGEREDSELWEALRRSHLIPETKSKSSSSTQSSKHSSSLEIESLKEFEAAGTIAATATSLPDGSVKDATTELEIVDPSKITLDTPVKESGSNFSQGQRQLIALARALVRKSKIIIMDEATASVDFETDLKIQTTIREEMVDSTVITIAHRIRTVADFDRVLVMNAGEIAEYDTPLTLMQREDGLFRSLCERSNEFDALYAIAELKEKRDRGDGAKNV